ncbi:hypothetical protein LG293_17210 (plasmid) [Citricoccus nitrophenolicus]
MAQPQPPSPGLGAYREAATLDAPDLVDRLRGVLGAKLVAYLGEVQDTRSVRQWAQRESVPSDTVVLRLRLAHHLAGVIQESGDSPAVVQTWFLGGNPLLNDHSPARVLVEAPLTEARHQLIAAARSFASTG